MAIDKLMLYNGALRLCGEGKVTLTENREPRRLLDDVWAEGAVKYCLEQGQWSFAIRTLRLEPDPAKDTEFGYRNAYPKPDDYCGLAAIAADEYFRPGFSQYDDNAKHWFTDIDELFVKIISDDPDYGGDYSLWDITFAKYVMSYMAFEVAPRLTGVKVDMDKLERIMDKRLSNAANKDGFSRPTRFPNQGSWNNSRFGNNVNNGRKSERWS